MASEESLDPGRRQRLQMLHAINSLRKSQTFCDVFLMVGDRRIPAHRIVLAASSPVFKASLTSELKRQKEGEVFDEVQVSDFDPDTIEEMLNFIYTGEVGITLTYKKALELILAADYYDLENLKEFCVAFLKINLMPSNCLLIQMYAERYRLNLLQEETTYFICKNLTLIWKTEEYLTMEFAEVKELFSGDRLAIETQKGEEEVFQGIKAWVQHDKEKREHYFDELFGYTRLTAMSSIYIWETIYRDELVSRSPSCRDLVTATLNLSEEERDEPRGITESVVLLSKNGLSFCYIPECGSWLNLTRLSSYNTIRAVTVCEGHVFAIGWENDRITIEKFDLHKNYWVEILNDEGPKPVAAVAVADKIFILNERSVTIFKPADGSSRHGAEMASVRRGLCAVALNDRVYAIGGYDSLQNLGLNTVESYDRVNNEWMEIKPMNEQRCFAAATVLSCYKILVVGGTRDCCLQLSNCELYDPITDIWSLLPAELNVPRCEAAIAKSKNKVFVFGGTYSGGRVESYENGKEWKEIGRIPTKTTPTCACVVLLPKKLVNSLKGQTLLCD